MSKHKKPNGHTIPKMNADLFFKRCMTDIDLARDFLTFNLPEKIKDQIELASLKVAPQEYISAALRRKTADMVYTVKLKDAEDELGFLVLHVEQQTKPKRLMPLRMLEFMTTIMRQFTENQPSKDFVPLPVVIPIILSTHKGKYPYSTRFLDLFTEPGQKLVSALLNDELPLVDLASMSDDTLKKHLRSAIMEIALKNVKNSEFGPLLMDCVEILKLLIYMREIDTEQASGILQSLVYYMADNVKNIPTAGEVDDLLATAQSELPSDTGEVFMTLREHFEESGAKRGMEQGKQLGIQQGIQQGKQLGMQQGKQLGMQQGVQQVALNMLKKGLSDEDVCACTGLSIEKIIELKHKD